MAIYNGTYIHKSHRWCHRTRGHIRVGVRQSCTCPRKCRPSCPCTQALAVRSTPNKYHHHWLGRPQERRSCRSLAQSLPTWLGVDNLETQTRGNITLAVGGGESRGSEQRARSRWNQSRDERHLILRHQAVPRLRGSGGCVLQAGGDAEESARKKRCTSSPAARKYIIQVLLGSCAVISKVHVDDLSQAVPPPGFSYSNELQAARSVHSAAHSSTVSSSLEPNSFRSPQPPVMTGPTYPGIPVAEPGTKKPGSWSQIATASSAVVSSQSATGTATCSV